MPYFNYIPDIKYDTKPISYPFSESEYVVAKNFFRRYKISDDFKKYAVFFKQYNVSDFEKPWTIANIAYGDPQLDWVILLTNNIVNPLFDWPQDSFTLRKILEGKYNDPYGAIKHYETFYKTDSTGVVVQNKGIIVDQQFYTDSHKYYDSGTNQVVTSPGNEWAKPVTIFEYESDLNDNKKNIFLLKPVYLDNFIREFRTNNKYSDSTDTITSRLKKTGV